MKNNNEDMAAFNSAAALDYYKQSVLSELRDGREILKRFGVIIRRSDLPTGPFIAYLVELKRPTTWSGRLGAWLRRSFDPVGERRLDELIELAEKRIVGETLDAVQSKILSGDTIENRPARPTPSPGSTL